MVDRFYVREHSGHITMTVMRATPEAIEVMVIDRADCHNVVRSFLPRLGQHRGPSLSRRRDEAAALCAELNEWNDAA